MPQLSLYIDKVTLNKIEKVAKIENISISKFVSSKLKTVMNTNWPKNYFDLFGAIDDDTFKKPKNIQFEHDIKRESI